MDIFTYPLDDYRRQVDIIPEYVEYSAIYASKMTGVPLDICREHIRKNIKSDGTHPINDPAVKMLQRNKFGDRRQKDTTFGEYIHFATKNELILAPTLTAYLNPNQRKSFNAEYIVGNMNKRKIFKNAMLDCKLKDDMVGYGYNKIVQDGCKVKNNSMSGAHSSPSTPLFNKSSHSTLTSCCRISTSYANAGNEWFIRGNRHYHHPQIVIADLISCTRHYDLDATMEIIYRYNLHVPTVDEVMDTIHYSSKNYWQSTEVDEVLRFYAERMSDAERALFCYRSDMYHTAKYNPEFIREFLGHLSARVVTPDHSPEAELALKDGDTQTLACLICSDIMKGRTLQDVKKESFEDYGIVAATALNAYNTVIRYADFIRVLWRAPVLPASIAKFPLIIRKCVVTSDTDSSIFTNQYWTKWFTNGELFSPKTYDIGYTVTFLRSKMVKHSLALMSANLGIIKEHRHLISMKNEYYYPIYSLTAVAKHYYGLKSAQEGRILKKLDAEIKGVHLRSSAAPPEVTEKLADFMMFIMKTILSGRKLRIHEVLDPVAELELEIMEDIRKGGFRFMRNLQIKDANGYTAGEDNHAYKQYLYWNEVFGPTYGEAPPPPYEAVKAPIKMDSRRKFTRWLESIQDPDVRDRAQAWAEREGKFEKNIIAVPLMVCTRIGLPPEISQHVAAKSLIKDIISPFYNVLESLGLYYLDDDFTRMLSEQYVPTSRRLPSPATA